MSIINEALKKAAMERSSVSEFVSESSREADRLLQIYSQQRILQRRKWVLFGGISGTLLASVVAFTIFFGSDSPFSNTLLQKEEVVEVASAPVINPAPVKELIPVAPLPPAPPVVIEKIKIKKPILPKKYVKLPSLSLSGITKGRGESLAVINNRVVGMGDNVQGAIVVKIDADSVSLLYQDQEFILRIP